MFRSLSTMCALAVIACAGGGAWAQSSPIPDSRVPGFGGTDPGPGVPGGSPGSSGSAIGSNVGAGATASPVVTEPKRPAETAEVPPTKPLIGLSRDLPLR
ncbi:MAG: hypothetical protein KIS73_16880 [Enhydrobacter sp.]|nr:hypothetical protein [Enhydrobacter sp.]